MSWKLLLCLFVLFLWMGTAMAAVTIDKIEILPTDTVTVGQEFTIKATYSGSCCTFDGCYYSFQAELYVNSTLNQSTTLPLSYGYCNPNAPWYYYCTFSFNYKPSSPGDLEIVLKTKCPQESTWAIASKKVTVLPEIFPVAVVTLPSSTHFIPNNSSCLLKEGGTIKHMFATLAEIRLGSLHQPLARKLHLFHHRMLNT